MLRAFVQRGIGRITGAPAYTDFVSAFTADPRVIGVWQMNDEHVSMAASNIAAIANLKIGGPALVNLDGNRTVMKYDPLLRRNVMTLSPALPAHYACTFNLGDHAGGFTMGAFMRPTAEAYYSGYTYLLSTDGTWPLIHRGNRSAAPVHSPLSEAVIYDQSDESGVRNFTASVVVNDPYGWQDTQITFDASAALTMDINGGTQSISTATSLAPGVTTKFFVGTPHHDRMPTASVDAVYLLGCDINAAAHVDLKRVLAEFKDEMFC